MHERVQTVGFELSFGITTSYPIKLGRYMASTGERYGVRSIWVGDDIGGPHDVYSYTSLILSASSKLNVGIGVVSPFYYNISTIARSSATIVELHGERFRLGLGVGGLKTLEDRDMAPTRAVDGLRKAVEALKTVFKGETVSLDTFHFKLFDYSLWDRFRIPIYLGVRDPKLLRLASRIADGAILSGPKPYLEEASKLFRDAKASRDFKLIGWLPTVVLDEKGSGVPSYATKVVATVATDTPNRVLEAGGIDVGKVERIRQGLSLKRWDRVIELIDEEFADLFLFYGSPSSLMSKFEEWARSNHVDEMVYGPPYGLNPEKSLKEVASTWRDWSSP